MAIPLSRPRGFAVIGLDNPKSAANVGAALRAAGCFGAAQVVVRGIRYTRASTDTLKAYRHLPLWQVDGDIMDYIPFDCVPVAVDLIEGAVPLPEYKHPERAFYVFGAEDATLGRKITDRCRDTVFIPMMSGCLNLAMAVNIVLYDRAVKRGRPAGQPATVLESGHLTIGRPVEHDPAPPARPPSGPLPGSNPIAILWCRLRALLWCR